MRPDPAPLVTLAPANGLAALAVGINAAHARCEAAARDALARAVDAGNLLNRAKAAVPHGAWLDWLAANCPGLPARTAQVYMRVARHGAELDAKCAAVAHLPLRDAVKLLAEPNEPDGTAAPTPPVVPAGPRVLAYTPFQHMLVASRHDLVDRWPDLRFQYAALLDVAGWPVDRIADAMGLPPGVVTACPSLDPRPPGRFDRPENGAGVFGGGVELTRDLERRYRDTVLHLLAGWACRACEGAARRAEHEGLGELAGPLSAVAAAHGRRADRLTPWPAPFFRDGGDNVALNCVALTDARLAAGVDDPSGEYVDDLMPLFERFKGVASAA